MVRENETPNNLTPQELEVKMMEYKNWTDAANKQLDILVKYLISYSSIVGIVFLFNMNHQFNYPGSLSLLFVLLLSVVSFGACIFPACYLFNSHQLLDDLTRELNAKLVPNMNSVRDLLIGMVILFLLCGVLAGSIFFKPEWFNLH